MEGVVYMYDNLKKKWIEILKGLLKGVNLDLHMVEG